MDDKRTRASARDLAAKVGESLRRNPSASRPRKPRTIDGPLEPLPVAPSAGYFAEPQPQGLSAFLPHESPSSTPFSDLESEPRLRDEPAAVTGIAAAPAPPSVRPQPPPPAPSLRTAQSWLGARASDTRLDEVRAAAAGPDATMSQKVAAEEAGRQAIKGDKFALKAALASLVEKFDLSSPTDSAVLMPAMLGDQATLQMMTLLGRGKMAVDSTPGGQMFQRIAPILKKVSPVDVSGEVDQAWAGMSEKFATQAKGSIDVVLHAGKESSLAGKLDLPAPGGPLPDSGAGPPGSKLTLTEVSEPGDATQGVRLGDSENVKKLAIREVDTAIDNDSDKVKKLTLREVGAAIDDDPKRLQESMRARKGLGVREVEPGDAGVDDVWRVETGAATGQQDSLRLREVQNELPSEQAAEIGTKETRLRIREIESDGATPGPVTPAPKGTSTSSRSQVVEVLQSSGVNPRIAGRLTLRDLIAVNPDISQINLHEVVPGGGESQPLVRSLGGMTRDALMQRFKF